MDEFRIEIWDFLYRADGPKSINQIAENVNQDDQVVCSAIDHHWFDVRDDMVSIAYGTA